METRARERITGAVILVALMVLLVPELLSGPRHAAATGTLPAAAASPAGTSEAPLRSYTVDLNAASPPVAQASALQAGGTAAADAPAPATAPATPDAAPTAAPAPAAAAPKPTPAATPAPAPAKVAAPAPKPAPKPAPAAAAPRAGSTAANGATITGWSVQVGSFASQVNADHLAHQLKGKGFTAVVSEMSSGGRKLFRVRVGPVADHAAAQELLTKLRAAGQSGSIVPHP